MDIQATMSNLSVDWATGKAVVGFTTDADKEELSEIFNLLKGKLLDLEFRVHRKKRSVEANKYMWQLLNQMAKKQREKYPELVISRQDLYEMYLDRCSNFELDADGNAIPLIVKDQKSVTYHEGHWKCVGQIWSEEGLLYSFLKIRGSSQFDTKEMQEFVQFIVEDAKEMGIETLTPEEVMKMDRLLKERYGA